MSEWRRTVSRGKRDTAEPEVIKAFLGAGATVRQLSGKDTPDLLVGYLGADHTVEVKTDNARLLPGQKRFAETWNGSPPVVARTPAQARRWLKRWEEDARATRIEFPRAPERTCATCGHLTGDAACDLGLPGPTVRDLTPVCGQYLPRPVDWIEALEAQQREATKGRTP